MLGGVDATTAIQNKPKQKYNHNVKVTTVKLIVLLIVRSVRSQLI